MLLKVAHPDFEDARQALAGFAELEKSPEHIHTRGPSPVPLLTPPHEPHPPSR